MLRILLWKELRSIFYSPVAYLVLTMFLLVSGLTFFTVLQALSETEARLTVMRGFFQSIYFWFAFLPVFPLITMRLFSEEYKLGTIEPLLTAPVNDWQVVLSKFFAAMGFFLLLFLPLILYFRIFEWISGTPAADSAGTFWTTLLIMVLVGMAFVALGCLASALTRNQIVAAAISLCLCLALLFAGDFAIYFFNPSASIWPVISYFSISDHVDEFSRGIVDTRRILFYATFTLLVLIGTFHVFQYRKWRT
jgi:ABC-2 type transport system permease protein